MTHPFLRCCTLKCEAWVSLLQGRVPSVLYVIIRPTLDHSSNFDPLVPILLVELNQEHVFFGGPGLAVVAGIQVIAPAFTALLANATGKAAGELCPILCSVLTHEFNDRFVLLSSPRAFDKRRIHDLSPPLCDLLGCLPREMWRQLGPIRPLTRFQQLQKALIFARTPSGLQRSGSRLLPRPSWG
jgi:hypothetical protein